MAQKKFISFCFLIALFSFDTRAAQQLNETKLIGSWALSEVGLADFPDDEKLLIVEEHGTINFNKQHFGNSVTRFRSSTSLEGQEGKFIQRFFQMECVKKFNWKIVNATVLLITPIANSCTMEKFFENGRNVHMTAEFAAIEQEMQKQMSDTSASQNLHILELSTAKFRYWTGHTDVPVSGLAKKK